MAKKAAWVVCLALILGCLTWTMLAQESEEELTFVLPENLPELRAPIIVTTCGQSPGALMVKLICDSEQVAIACEEMDLLTADELLAECPEDIKDFAGVLFVTTGTSLKGMGAAGVDVDSEVARCIALVEAARDLGMIIIVGQIEGPSRRVDEYDEASIRAMSPLADLLITRTDVNEDGYFTDLAEELEIPQIFIEETLDLEVLLPLLFPPEAEEAETGG
jgi:hypothetical protein